MYNLMVEISHFLKYNTVAVAELIWYVCNILFANGFKGKLKLVVHILALDSSQMCCAD